MLRLTKVLLVAAVVSPLVPLTVKGTSVAINSLSAQPDCHGDAVVWQGGDWVCDHPTPGFQCTHCPA